MDLLTIPRLATRTSLALLRVPLRLAGAAGLGTGADRVDAAAREAAGAVTGDAELQREAEAKRTAADERDRSARTAAAAEQRAAKAKQRRTAAKRKSTETAAKRHEATRKGAKQAQDAISGRADKERLAALDKEAKALDRQAAAQKTAEKAETLAAAAAAAKEVRKA